MDLDGSCIPWPGVIRPHDDPGLATCLQDRQICKGCVPLPVSRFEFEAVCLAEWAVARGRVLVLCPPDPLAPLAELIAAAVHVSDMAEQYRQTHWALGSRRRVAVVTSDFRARGLYRGLGVRNPYGGTAPLRDVVPAATLGRDGVVRILGDVGRGWSTVFVSSTAEIERVGKIDLAVVDLGTLGGGATIDLGIPVVAIARDPADPMLLRLPDTALMFGWPRSDLESVRGRAGLPPRLATRARGEVCEVVGVPAHGVCENAALFWQDVGPLVRLSGRSGVTRELARVAFALFYDLLGLALPLETYEALTAPIHRRLDAIASATRLTRGEARDLYLPMVEAELRDFARSLGASPPKHDVLVSTLGSLLDDHRDVMLVARTAELARLHTLELASHAALAGVRVTSLGSLPDEAPAEVAVLTGMAPTRARWVYRAGIAATLVVLAYTPDGPTEPVTGGFDEVDIVRRVIADQRARESWFGRAAAKDGAWSQLSGEPRRIHETEARTPPRGEASGVDVVLATPAEVPPGLWDGVGWLAPLEPGGGAVGAIPDGLNGAHAPGAVVPAVRVNFEGGRWALMNAAGTVTRFRPGSGTAEAAFEVGKLRPGDQVLFLDRDSRKDLLAKVIEVAAEVPAQAAAAAWTAHWRRVLVKAYRYFGSYPAFRSALQEHGCRVQAQTVRLWVIGVTIGPDDEADVHRVGLATGDPVLLSQHGEICRAIRSLRGAHDSLTRRLSELALRVRSAAAAGYLDPDTLVDERSGLTAADFQESVDILTVSSIEGVGDVPYLLLGQLNEPEDDLQAEGYIE